MLLILPSELVYQISLKLTERGNKKNSPIQHTARIVSEHASTLAALSLVCRRLHDIVEPILFERIEICFRFMERIEDGETSSIVRNLALYPTSQAHVK